MKEAVFITFLANAGLLIRYKDHSLLLDALQSSEDLPFSPLPTALWKDILSGEGLFSGVNALLFTHLHPDHFSPEMTAEYIRRHAGTIVMLPGCGAESVASHAGETILLANNAPVRYTVSPGISVLAIPTRHLDRHFHDVPHFCYLISFEDKNVLFTADFDYTKETLSSLEGMPLQAVFVNPFFFGAMHSDTFRNPQVQAKQTVIYHIPFPSDDVMNLRAYVKASVSRCEEPSRVIVLEKPLQNLWV